MVGVFRAENGLEFLVLRSGTEGWKFWAVSNSPGWVWRLPSCGPICVICDDLDSVKSNYQILFIFPLMNTQLGSNYCRT